jgi:hypothetical protein
MQEPVQKIEPITPTGKRDPSPQIVAQEVAAGEAPAAVQPQGETLPAAVEGPRPVAFTEIALRFRVDPKSGQITVLVLDKTSRRVLRTIPPEEVEKLSAGDLLELFA